jgi:cold shock CspA family protein
MKTEHIASFTYQNGDGFAFFIGDAPPDAGTKADVIHFTMVKKDRMGTLVDSQRICFTPDEAASIAQGLLTCVNAVMDKKFHEFRREMDSQL